MSDLLYTAVLVCHRPRVSPEVDRAAPAFDAQVYAIDLDACRGGPDSAAALESITQFVQGALIGTYHGLVAGAVSGDAPEGMAIGAVIGAVIGLGTGWKPFGGGQQLCEVGPPTQQYSLMGIVLTRHRMRQCLRHVALGIGLVAALGTH